MRGLRRDDTPRPVGVPARAARRAMRRGQRPAGRGRGDLGRREQLVSLVSPAPRMRSANVSSSPAARVTRRQVNRSQAAGARCSSSGTRSASACVPELGEQLRATAGVLREGPSRCRSQGAALPRRGRCQHLCACADRGGVECGHGLELLTSGRKPGVNSPLPLDRRPIHFAKHPIHWGAPDLRK